MGFGGFAISVPRPFVRGLTHKFIFAARNGVEVSLIAKAVHCYSRTVDGQMTFVSGWEFMAGSAQQTEAEIGRLLQSVTAA